MFPGHVPYHMQGSNLHKVLQLLTAMTTEATERGTRGDALVKFAGVMWQALDPYHNPETGMLIACIALQAGALMRVLDG